VKELPKALLYEIPLFNNAVNLSAMRKHTE